VAGLDIYLFHVRILMCQFIAPLLVAHGALGPLMISPERCNLPFPSVHVHLSCDLVGFPFLFLTDITPQVMLCLMAEVMPGFHFLE